MEADDDCCCPVVAPAMYDLVLFTESCVDEYKQNGNSGFDLRTFRDPHLPSGMYNTHTYAKVIRRSYCPNHTTGRAVAFYLYARSSTFLKTGCVLANGVGLIDKNYNDTLKAVFVQAAGAKRALDGLVSVQIVAPDGQPFGSVRRMKTKDEWDAFVRRCSGADRGGGFGSTDKE